MPVRYNSFQRLTIRFITALMALVCGLLFALIIEVGVGFILSQVLIGWSPGAYRLPFMAAVFLLLCTCTWVGALITARIGRSFFLCTLLGLLLGGVHFLFFAFKTGWTAPGVTFVLLQVLVGPLGYLPRWRWMRRIAREKQAGEEQLLAADEGDLFVNAEEWR